jgi:hypothetical protein
MEAVEAVEGKLKVGFERVKGRNKVEMLVPWVDVLRRVVWCHPRPLSSSWCLKKGVYIVEVVC